MSARGVVPAFDELEARNAGFCPGLELPAVEQLALKGREEALAHRVIATITN